MSKYGIFSGLYFPAFGLNTERYAVSVRMHENTGTTETPNTDTFYAVTGISEIMYIA